MKYSEAVKKLKRLGCREFPRHGKGSHRKWHNPATGRGTVLPDWGARDLKPGTIRAAVHQLGINWQEFKKS